MPVNILSTKSCTKCEDNKPLTEFCKSKSTKDGLNYWCKTCAGANGAAWRKANPDKSKASCATWVAQNYERKNASRIEWNKANPERVKANRLAYREENAARIKAVSATWRAANPGGAIINLQNRRARLKKNVGTLSRGLREKLFLLQKGKCACCSKPLGGKYHMDHIMPLARGGTNTDENMQLLRAKCNLQKHAAHPIDFMRCRGFLL